MTLNFKNIVNSAWKQRGPVTFVYLISLLLSGIFSFKVFKVLNENIGNSMILERMKGGFNKQVFWDILNGNKHLQHDLILQFSTLLLIYLFVSMVLNGGLISNISKKQTTIKLLIKDGLKNLFPFFIISLISSTILVLSLTLIWVGYFKVMGNPIEDYTTEKPFVYSFIIMALISFLVLGKVWGFSVLCRISFLYKRDIFSSLIAGSTLLKKYILEIIITWLLLLITGILISYTFLTINASQSSETIAMVIATVLLMQLLMWIKSFIKAIGYSAINNIFLDQRSE